MVKATQPELTRLKNRHRFLEKGYNLLELKRQQLFEAMKNTSLQFFQARRALIETINADFNLFKRNFQLLGKEKIQILALLNRIHFEIGVDIKFINKYGVDVPDIKLEFKEEALPVYSFSDTPLHFDTLLLQFKETLKKIIKLAELDNVLYHFALNYQKIQRRIKALEDMILPRLSRDIHDVEEILEDLEQEEFIQIKNIKELLESLQV
jgi:V/A-type H+-transporting ATPase subunit D